MQNGKQAVIEKRLGISFCKLIFALFHLLDELEILSPPTVPFSDTDETIKSVCIRTDNCGLPVSSLFPVPILIREN